MYRVLAIMLTVLSALALAGCGQAPDKTGELPKINPAPTQAHVIDERLRGKITLPVISGVFTLRPDKSIMEVQRLQVSGSRDSVSMSCLSNVGSAQWWQIRVDTNKTIWQMRLREGRDMDPIFAELLVGSPGCVLKASSVADPLLMAMIPLEVQPFVYEGSAGAVHYTVKLPASAQIVGATVQVDPPLNLSKGVLTCQQIVGDSANGASADPKVVAAQIKPLKVPAGKKFKTPKAKALFMAQFNKAQAAATTAAWKKGFLLGKAGSVGDKMEIDPQDRQHKNLILVHGIVGQITSREPARQGGLWCGIYKAGKGFGARFTNLAKLDRVNIADVPTIAAAGLPAKVAKVLSDSGALGVKITTDAPIIARNNPTQGKTKTPVATVEIDSTRTQLVGGSVLIYANETDAAAALKALEKLNISDRLRQAAVTLSAQNCEMVVQLGPADIAGSTDAAQQAVNDQKRQAALVQIDKIRTQLQLLCKPKPAAK